MDDAFWARLRRVLEAASPGVPRGGLNPPATEAQVAAVERLVGHRLPEDLRAAYLHFNGMTRPGGWPNGGLPLVAPRFDWCDLETMAHRWTMDRELQMPTLGMDPPDDDEWSEAPAPRLPHRTAFQDPGWLPIGRDNTSATACIDMNPTSLGHPGQLLEVDSWSGGARWMAAGFAEHVDRLLWLLESGDLRWHVDRFLDADADGDGVLALPGAPEAR